MTNTEIASLIKEKRERLNALVEEAVFTLNKEILTLNEEIENLQKQCQHEFVSGTCKYCEKGE